MSRKAAQLPGQGIARYGRNRGFNRRGVEVLQPPHVNSLSAALGWARFRRAIKPGEALPSVAECLRSLRAVG